MNKTLTVPLILLLLLMTSILIADDEQENTSFAQRRQQAQQRAEEYNNSIYSGDQRASDDEIAAAIKNFNPEVEQQYIQDHRELESSFILLNRLEKQWNFATFDRKHSEEWDQWMLQGQIGAFAPEAE
ncbi:MAG: hypothetical protein APR63_14125 [Desulfuromonas sp. SDB]|nr:MAG: hypothetical protein APR63_14125 [Desulfuromonas sp. SDB]